MHLVHNLDESPWRDFVNSHVHSSIFHTPEMFEVFARARGHRPGVWAVVDRDHRPLALFLPVEITLMDGRLRRLTTRAIAYGSALCAPGSEGQHALEMLLKAYKGVAKQKALFTELRNLSDLNHLQSVLQENGFAYEEHLNYLVDLNHPPEEVLQRIGQRTRKKIRHSLRQGRVVVEEATQRDQVRLCYELLRQTYAAARVPLADWSLFEAAFDILCPRGMVKFLLAHVDESCAAGSVELIYKDTIYGWYGGMDRAYGDYIPNELLLWYIFRWGAENGYRVYDFGGAGKPHEEYGVRDFKAKFGGELVCYGRNTCIHQPILLRMSQWGYAGYRRLLSLVQSGQ